MRIAIVNSFFHPVVLGGAERTIFSLAEGLRARGHDVLALSLGPKGPPQRPKGALPYATELPIRNLYRPDAAGTRTRFQKALWHGIDIYNPAARRQLAHALRVFAPDVVSCHNLSGFSCAAWGAAQETGVPVVQVLHDYYLMCLRTMRSRGDTPCKGRCGSCRALRWPHGVLSAQVDGVVGISQHILGSFLEEGYFPNARIRVAIHNAETPLSPDVLAEPAPPALVFGFIGTLAPHKGVEILLAAFQGWAGATGATLLVAGTGRDDYVARLRAQYNGSNIRFLGPIRPGEFFPRLSVSVVPSLSDEPLGRVVFESLGYGIPVIGSARGGIPEIVTPGVNGWLVPAGDIVALRRAFDAAAASAGRLSKHDLAASVHRFFDLDRFVGDYEGVYAAVAGQAAA